MYKQVIVIRTDIKMSCGKMCAQCCHASLGAAEKADKKTLRAWKSDGQKKVVVKSELKEILSLKEQAKKLKISNFLVSDAGMTELSHGTVTALAIGPGKEEHINKITSRMELL